MAARLREQPALDENSALIARDEPGDFLDLHSNDARNQENWAYRRISVRLYISHFLSTWNSRVFEFGSVLYLASIYPRTLLPMSVYALSRGVVAILFAPAVGYYIDIGNRLRVVRFSIGELDHRYHALLACVEKLCSIMNMISVERDWVVVVAGEDHSALATMNARMRRIDLICKLFGPLFIAFIDGISTETAILVNLGMNTCSVFFEYFAIARVYYNVPELQNSKGLGGHIPPHVAPERRSAIVRISDSCRNITQKALGDFNFYFRHTLFLPSFAGALLYLTVLSFGAQMVTWLLAAGYSSAQVAITRTLSVVFEVLATWVAPWLMGKIGPIRAGLWFSNWQIGVEAESRGTFSSTEAAWQNFFEICSFISTIVFSRPAQFRWPALISLIAVSIAGALYMMFVRIQRGHLVHLPEFLSQDRLHRSREHGLERILSSPDF
ncbi:Solute carrier family 40 protein [Trichophyton interdigitale]|uniref:Solute carrier family 40 member n=1 Tax=Trichophyton interdigitale TaxID=101480 RepID=A0A9P4YP43_9EURO|nr:Solute carrier family 40 protein [Trichophyton interdigitale]KAF3901237.1 Solute carrier family 40 protein [Trichophyton interdigitale]KAG8212111.1 Solute carrier family 40 protein [Trichophyton interdigitale]